MTCNWSSIESSQRYPLASAANEINTPWPKDIYSNQQWSVIPKIDSQGQIVSLKGWHYQAVDPAQPSEQWQFTGRVQQVSKRNKLVFLIVRLQQPQAQKAILGLTTTILHNLKLAKSGKLSPNVKTTP